MPPRIVRRRSSRPNQEAESHGNPNVQGREERIGAAGRGREAAAPAASRRAESAHAGAKTFPSRALTNQRQRQTYAEDADYREHRKRSARDAYRREHPAPPNPIAQGRLAREGVTREVSHPRQGLTTLETFTVVEAAEALGKSESQFRRWLDTDIMPQPYLQETTRGYRVYDRGELEQAARILARHAREFTYLGQAHQHVINDIHQHIHAYRAGDL